MIEDNYLPLFINDELFILKDAQTVSIKDKPEGPMAEPKVPESIVEEPKEELKLVVHELSIWTPPLTVADKELLINILKAIKKDFHNAKLMEGIDSYESSYKQLLCFGYQKELQSKLSCNLPSYQPTAVGDKTILISVAPAELHTDKAEKGNLWKSLQTMFGV